MGEKLKTLVIVLTFAWVVFLFAKPAFTKLMSLEAYRFRTRLWTALTVLGFLSPSSGIFFFVAAGLLAWAATKDDNPIALYLCALHIVPPNRFEMSLGVNLIPLDLYRVLGIAILIPLAFKLQQSRGPESKPRGIGMLDAFIILYCGMGILTLMPYEAITNTLRRLFLVILDCWLIYFVASRGLQDKDKARDAIATFCLICAVHVPIAAFEAARTWPLYSGIAQSWGLPDQVFTMRADKLRAQSSSGHPLALGFMLALAFGFWLYLRNHLQSKKYFAIGAAWFWLGLIAAYSRAPWFVAIFVMFVYLFLGKNGMSRVLKASATGVLVAGVFLMTPMGAKVVDSLPFIGTVDSSTVDYRQQLAEASWVVIKMNPLFGDPFYERNMEHIREIQGEGLVDMVNAFAGVALAYGFFGLTCFLGLFIVGMTKSWSRMKYYKSIDDHERASLGAILISAMCGSLLMMATGSFGTAVAVMSWMLAGLLAAYSAAPVAIRR